MWRGQVVCDAGQKLPGRGVYIDARLNCWKKMNEIKRWQVAASSWMKSIQAKSRTEVGARNKKQQENDQRENRENAIRIGQANLEQIMDQVRSMIPELASVASSGRKQD